MITNRKEDSIMVWGWNKAVAISFSFHIHFKSCVIDWVILYILSHKMAGESLTMKNGEIRGAFVSDSPLWVLNFQMPPVSWNTGMPTVLLKSFPPEKCILTSVINSCGREKEKGNLPHQRSWDIWLSPSLCTPLLSSLSQCRHLGSLGKQPHLDGWHIPDTPLQLSPAPIPTLPRIVQQALCNPRFVKSGKECDPEPTGAAATRAKKELSCCLPCPWGNHRKCKMCSKRKGNGALGRSEKQTP